jgi:hypothetical protein
MGVNGREDKNRKSAIDEFRAIDIVSGSLNFKGGRTGITARL